MIARAGATVFRNRLQARRSGGLGGEAGKNSGGPFGHIVAGLLAGGGLWVDAGDVAGVFGVQRDGDAEEVFAQRRERLGQWLADEDFAAAFGIRGRPGWPPSRLALVTVLQRAEKLTGRAAAEAVRTFHPAIVYPYHYRGSDTNAFAKALEGTGIEVRLRDWYAK